ncbi:TPA: TIGR03757 family integrating conjugative element protein [Salmonella enterica]|uniref:TIGR03757 family integrating conjugative element protein n=1 Tax=Salmonella enterica TaxID=28901 RepID=A0A744CBL0_SALER|nr:TIGR03757 family integrating conjugative element protein [Salmonella enterica]HAF4919960.1 TIGR03757 family integrating conjugative element protein [Salmonella enterica]
MNLPRLISTTLAFIVWPAFAADIHVFTDLAHPVHSVPPGVTVVELDAGERLENELSAGLPADPAQAARLVQRRLEREGSTLQHRLATAYQGVTKAWVLGVSKIPAVVVDHRYVIYGEPDVGLALTSITRYRKAHP